MNVRIYVHVEPGKAKLEMVDGYPQELLAIDLNHTVESLSKISPINIGTLNDSILSPEQMVPYDVQLLVGNVAGCSDVTTSQPFFTREGGIYIDDLQSVCCDYLLHLYYIPAPISPPHNVMVERLPNGTAMNVSFTRLSIVEARSINITYTLSSTHSLHSPREKNL